MKRLLLCVSLLLAVGCSGKPSARSCANVEKDARPKLAMTWKLEHGALDNDPPRTRIKLAITGAATANIDAGELEGVCKLNEIGAETAIADFAGWCDEAIRTVPSERT